VVGSSLDILAELTARYGAALPDQEGLKRALLPELAESRAGVRKRAIQCLAALAAALPPESLDDLCSTGGWAGGGGGGGGRRGAGRLSS
jgi:cullin-associated NEDD8-dissociated protein 1